MDPESKQTTGMQGNGMVMQAHTVQGLALSADGFTLALGRRMATPGRCLTSKSRTARGEAGSQVLTSLSPAEK
jgi:hypothetical protein